MKTKFMLNLILLVLVAGLAAIVFFDPEVEEAKAVHLADLDENNLTKMTLENKESIVFELRQGHWWLTQPILAPANEIKARQLLDIAMVESLAQYPLETQDLAKFELDKPKVKLTLGHVKLLFGGFDPIDMRRYVQVNDTLHLVNDDFSHHLNASSIDFIDKKLLPEEVTPNEIVAPDFKAKLGENGQWAVEPPVEDASGMADLLHSWQSARGIEIKKIEPPLKGDTVHIGFINYPSIDFTILQKEPELILARADWGLQYLLAGESAKQLLSLQKSKTQTSDEESQETEGETREIEETEE